MESAGQKLDILKTAIRERVFTEEQPIITPHGTEAKWLFDFRRVTLDPNYLPLIAELFWERYKDHYPFQVGGQEAAAIGLVAAIVMKGVELGKPVNGFFLRKSRKKTGLLKTIEGNLTDEPIILIDDLINSGQTVNRQIEVLTSLGKHVTNVFALLKFRDDTAYRFITERGARFYAPFSLDDFGIALLSANGPEIPKPAFRTVWKFESGKPGLHNVVEKSAPAVDGERVYFGSDRGTFWALDQKDGSVAWQYEVGPHPLGKGIFSNPVLHDGMVYFGAYDGNVYALNAQTGKAAWVSPAADWIGSSPALAPDLGLLFIGLEFTLPGKRGGLAALNLKDGEKIWEFGMPGLTHGSPLYIPQMDAVFVGCNDYTLYCLNAKDGSLRWSYKTEGEIKSSLTYDPKRGLVLFGSFDGNLYALNAQGEKVFAFRAPFGFFSTPLVLDDTVYATSLDKSVYAVDLDTGELRWKYATHGRLFSSPTCARGSLWVGSNDGRLYALDPVSGKLKKFFQATERIVNAVAHNPQTGRLFVPTIANEIYCLEEL